MEFCVALFVLLVALFALGAGIKAVEAAELENQIAEMELAATRSYGAFLDERVERVRRYRHDVVGLLRAIELASGEGDGREGSDEAGRSDASSARAGRQYPEPQAYPLSNAVVWLNRRRCAEASLPFDCELEEGWEQCAMERNMIDSDLAVLFQNALDNAYEASMRIEDEGQRRMSLKVFSRKEAELRIEVANGVDSPYMPSFRTRKATPGNHGVGMRIIADVTAKYRGRRSVALDPRTHVLTVTIDFRE